MRDLADGLRELLASDRPFALATVIGARGSSPRPPGAAMAVALDGEALGHAVVIHCRGGLGRSGTVGGCVLVALGHTPDEAFAILRRARGPRCPETEEQRNVVVDFAKTLVERPVFRPAPTPLSAAGSLSGPAAKTAGCVIGAAAGDAIVGGEALEPTASSSPHSSWARSSRP